MREKGFVVFEDGTILPFGTYICPDEEGYLNSSTHEQDFINEILQNFTFKLYNYNYDKGASFYQNALMLSLQGLLIIINNQASKKGPSEILAYVPSRPTTEQISAISSTNKLLSIENQLIYAFNSEDFDDYTQFIDLNEYIKVNSKDNNSIGNIRNTII